MHCPCVGTSIARLTVCITHHFCQLSTIPLPKKWQNERWNLKTGVFQTGGGSVCVQDGNVKAVCLLCGDSVFVVKEHNVRARSHQTALLKEQPLQNRRGKNAPGKTVRWSRVLI